MSETQKSRRPPKPFRITFTHGDDVYTVVPLYTDTAQARKAFQLHKQAEEGQTYEVRVTPEGTVCNCKGFLYRSRCKHVVMLQDARMLD